MPFRHHESREPLRHGHSHRPRVGQTPGASKTLRVKFTVPDTHPAGPGNVFVAAVDSAAGFAESNETDNTVIGTSPFAVT